MTHAGDLEHKNLSLKVVCRLEKSSLSCGKLNYKAPMTENERPEDVLSPEVLDKIKHPPAIDDVMQQLPTEEVTGNPAMTPPMHDTPMDDRSDLKRDE